MEISNISEILRRNTQREKYNSGFVFYKNNYVSNNYTNLNGSNANFYGSVYDEYHRRTYTAMISIDYNTRIISNISCIFSKLFSLAAFIISDIFTSESRTHFSSIALHTSFI